MNALNERPKSKKIIKKAVIGAAVLFTAAAAASFPLKTVYYEISCGKIKEHIRIVQISDLHCEKYGENMKTLINAVDEATPDIIVLTGDIYDDVFPKENAAQLLKSIGGRYPCYYTAGNHEFRSAKWSEYKKEAQSLGVTVLEGENVTVKGITLCGSAAAADRSFSFDDATKKCAENAPEDRYNILLCHFPEDINYYRSFEKFDLILCGHAHGGHWRLPFMQNGLYAPSQGIFPKYSGGHFDFDSCTMIVSRGLARTRNVIPRIFNNPELVVIDLVN